MGKERHCLTDTAFGHIFLLLRPKENGGKGVGRNGVPPPFPDTQYPPVVEA